MIIYVYSAKFASVKSLKLCKIYQPVSFNKPYLDIYTDGLIYT